MLAASATTHSARHHASRWEQPCRRMASTNGQGAVKAHVAATAMRREFARAA